MAKRKQGSVKKQPVRRRNHLSYLRKALEWAIDPNIFSGLSIHGGAEWTGFYLVTLAIVWVWSEKPQLTAAFKEAATWMERMFDYTPFKSYQGMIRVLARYGGQLIPILWDRFHELMETVGGKHFRIGGWVPLAIDGSRISTPRSKSNEQAFRAKNYGKGTTAKYKKKPTKNKRKKNRTKESSVTPQIWITLVWHMGLRLPWCWKLGPSDSSERNHFREMLQTCKFAAKTLFCADAGFVGYDFWKSIIDAGHDFLIRVGGNVRLLTKLGYYAREHDGIVYVWTSEAMRKKQKPLILRLIHLKNERGDIYLVTNVLDSRRLSDAMASRLYARRWGIELQFRSFKQTFGRHTLRAEKAENAYAELEWSLIGLWMAHLFAVKEQLDVGQPPDHTSTALALHVVRDVLFHWCEIPKKGEDMTSQLRLAVHDSYERRSSKKARYRPNKKDTPSAGKPKITTATDTHTQKLERLRRHLKTVT